MSSSNTNKLLLKSKKERGNSKTEQSNKKAKNTKYKSKNSSKASNKEKIEIDSMKSEEIELEEDNPEETKQDNSLGQLTRNFLLYIKNKGRVNININDLVKDLAVKKRRIYDITNVLQGIGYIEKKGKNEISWTKNYNTNQGNSNSNIDSINENYISNCNQLKIEFEDLKKEDKKNDEKLNEYRKEFEILSKKIDFPRYSYVTFSDIKKLSKDEQLDFMIIKGTKGTIINVIDDEESKKAFTKIKSQMENGKIQKNEKLLSTLKNTHHIFFYNKDEQLKIYQINSGEIIENINNNIGAENNFNNSLISNNSINFSEEKNTNKIGNNIIKDNDFNITNDNINSTENITKTNIFNFGPNYKMNNYSILQKSNESSSIINNSINSSNKVNNNNLIFSFRDEYINNNIPNNNMFNLNKKNNNKLDDINENNNYTGISSMFQN